ncbi:unnamed protein product [Meloidogyne enterolobii]|uniref:Uncharacterized protein n=1 Tax=Meloidogyne enterolobii TaxID=390850 RepID=A0ACB1B186_MELEN
MNTQRHVAGSSTSTTTRKGSGTQKLSGSTSGNAWASQTEKNENIKIELNDLTNKNLNEENDRIDSLHIHTNPILRFIENSRLCRCSKRSACWDSEGYWNVQSLLFPSEPPFKSHGIYCHLSTFSWYTSVRNERSLEFLPVVRGGDRVKGCLLEYSITPFMSTDSPRGSLICRQPTSQILGPFQFGICAVFDGLLFRLVRKTKKKGRERTILANLGFLIVFGIRCNFGAAKNHMSRDFYDPWGKKHKHSFNWTSAELGVMESSFFYGYLITQIPAGFLVRFFLIIEPYLNPIFKDLIRTYSRALLLIPIIFYLLHPSIYPDILSPCPNPSSHIPLLSYSLTYPNLYPHSLYIPTSSPHIRLSQYHITNKY